MVQEDRYKFHSIHYLKSGNKRQQQAYGAITKLGIMADLQMYNPILCGTIPIGIDISTSDLDIVMEVYDFTEYELQVRKLYSEKKGFALQRKEIRGVPVIKANFVFADFEFELFAQPQPVEQQNAYLHMLIEHVLLEGNPAMREEVIKLKQQGIKTEPAFAQLLHLKGDPYEALLSIAKENICYRLFDHERKG
ncbi:DUF4269 domain-containing protein [Bacillus chungangensis]|uniref:Alpha/beta hydrolase n=1 Tax=Bacillus chungangensis TaxID=587633 RepID=A0ABT9WXM1_9BACI|nr:DUF4269 domain-containing protein [Bacillus chungangensis]MDQ0178044.1 hypothetical protein [Bacillus chungangensis]